MKHVIMGTAGHIDHGKTALIEALTGIDCDTHPEEKRRGITINLGFTHLDLPNGDSIGIVDVPGHRDFIRTMVAGASGIDFTLLVVAADSGVMPQTREHLRIMHTLGIRDGLIAITKIDRVDSELLEANREEIREAVAGMFLENAPVVEVSSVTGVGMPVLKRTIASVAARIAEKPVRDVFRMFIDRLFTVSGFGTVITGSVSSGSIQVEGQVYLLPGGNKKLRVRRLERHSHLVEKVRAGDRASVNLTGLERQEFRRGMMLSDRQLRDFVMIDAELLSFNQTFTFSLWQQVIFLTGTYEGQAKIHLLDRNELRGGDRALVQIHLDSPCVLSFGDRFIVRSTSSDLTLGGGRVLDAFPLHHRRRTENLLQSLSKLKSLSDLVTLTLSKKMRAATAREIASDLNFSTAEIIGAVTSSSAKDVEVFRFGDNTLLIKIEDHHAVREAIIDVIARFHRANPLNAHGLTIDSLAGQLPVLRDIRPLAKAYLKEVLESLAGANRLRAVKDTWALAGHTVSLDPKSRQKVEWIEQLLRARGMEATALSFLAAEAKKNKVSGLNQVLHFLEAEGNIFMINDHAIHSSIVSACRSKLLKSLVESNDGLTVAEFRDLVKGNRRICLLLLAQYDDEGVIERVGDRRIITDHGRSHLKTLVNR